MIPNLNRATERNVASVDLLIDTFLKLGLEGGEQFDPKAYLLEIAARAITRAVLSQDADHEQAVQIVGVGRLILLLQALSPTPRFKPGRSAVNGGALRSGSWMSRKATT
jgi:hypothetical protein